MNDNLKAVLKERLDKNYEAFMEQLQSKDVSEVINMAPKITAVQQLHEELLNACDRDDVEFLLQFDNPLEVAADFWESEITGYDHREEMGHMLWDIRDKGLYDGLCGASAEPNAPNIPENQGQGLAFGGL